MEAPLKYRGNETTIIVTPPEPPPDETTDSEITDKKVEEATCAEENDGMKAVRLHGDDEPRRAAAPGVRPQPPPIAEGASGAYTVEPDTRILAGAVTVAISACIVWLTAQPSGNVTVAIASDNPDVTVRPASLTFTPSKWDTAQGDGYGGQIGPVLVSVDDTLAPLAVNADAPAGVGVYPPPGSAASATVSAPADDTPTMTTGASFGIRKTADARSVVASGVRCAN